MLLIPVIGILSHPVQKAIKKCSMIESYKLGDYRYTVWQEIWLINLNPSNILIQLASDKLFSYSMKFTKA